MDGEIEDGYGGYGVVGYDKRKVGRQDLVLRYRVLGVERCAGFWIEVSEGV